MLSFVISVQSTEKCDKSLTTVNGQRVCRNVVIFDENFDSLSTAIWSHVKKIPQEPVIKLKFVEIVILRFYSWCMNNIYPEY